jgi:hypothetical protein
MEKNFESIAELIQDPHFVQQVKEGIDNLKENRSKRPSPKQGYHYTRDWYDLLVTQNNLTSEYFISNIEDIWNKKLSLSLMFKHKRAACKVIKSVCTQALYATHEYYKALPDEPAQDPAEKPKRTRKKKVATT